MNLIIIAMAVSLASALHLDSIREQTIAIIGTNDIHGSALPTRLVRFDTNESYNYGGLKYMAQMIKTVKK